MIVMSSERSQRVARTGSVRVPRGRSATGVSGSATVEADVDRTSLSALFRAVSCRIDQRRAEDPREPNHPPNWKACLGVYCGTIRMIRPGSGGRSTSPSAQRRRATACCVSMPAAATTDRPPRAGRLTEVRDKLAAFTITRPLPTSSRRFASGGGRRCDSRPLAHLAASADY